jgi:hypothetical protein
MTDAGRQALALYEARLVPSLRQSNLLCRQLRKVSGSALTVNGGGGSYTGATVSQKAVAFSLTPTSVTIGGGVTYNTGVGHVTNGIIQQFTFVGIEPDNCTTSGVGIHQ